MLFKSGGGQAERRGPEVSERATPPVALLPEDPECIGCKPGANSGSGCHIKMDSELFSMGPLFYQVPPPPAASEHSCWALKKRCGGRQSVSLLVQCYQEMHFKVGLKICLSLEAKPHRQHFLHHLAI